MVHNTTRTISQKPAFLAGIAALRVEFFASNESRVKRLASFYVSVTGTRSDPGSARKVHKIVLGITEGCVCQFAGNVVRAFLRA